MNAQIRLKCDHCSCYLDEEDTECPECGESCAIVEEQEPLPKTITIDYNGEEYTYFQPNQIKFVVDCQEAGFEVRHYYGRNFYVGPAVVCDDINRVRRATTIQIRYDSLGKEYIVYPG